MSRKKVGISPREYARTIENISRIRMDVARASGDEVWTESAFMEKVRIQTKRTVLKKGGNLASGVC